MASLLTVFYMGLTLSHIFWKYSILTEVYSLHVHLEGKIVLRLALREFIRNTRMRSLRRAINGSKSASIILVRVVLASCLSSLSSVSSPVNWSHAHCRIALRIKWDSLRAICKLKISTQMQSVIVLLIIMSTKHEELFQHLLTFLGKPCRE